MALGENQYPLDAALTAEFSDGAIAGRHQCQPVAVEPDHCASVYGLGDRFSQNHVAVETHLWWKAGWQLHWHHVVAHQPTLLRLGTYSLPLNERAEREVSTNPFFGCVSTAVHSIAVQPLHGFDRVCLKESNPQRRSHLLSQHSVLLAVETPRFSGERDVVALTWVGSRETPESWAVESSASGKLTLLHPKFGWWVIEQLEFPVIRPGSNDSSHC